MREWKIENEGKDIGAAVAGFQVQERELGHPPRTRSGIRKKQILGYAPDDRERWCCWVIGWAYSIFWLLVPA